METQRRVEPNIPEGVDKHSPRCCFSFSWASEDSTSNYWIYHCPCLSEEPSLKSVVPGLRRLRLRQEDYQLQSNLGCVLRCCLQTKSFLIRKCPREVLSAELKCRELWSVVKQCSVKPRASSHFVFFFYQTQPDKPVSKLLTATDNTQYTHVMLGYIDDELKVSGQCNYYYYYFWQQQDVGDGDWFIF